MALLETAKTYSNVQPIVMRHTWQSIYSDQTKIKSDVLDGQTYIPTTV